MVVETIDNVERPARDAVCHRPDPVIAAILTSLPSIETRDFEGDWLLRPTHFMPWRSAVSDEPEARSKYLDLIKILETEAIYWPYLSHWGDWIIPPAISINSHSLAQEQEGCNSP